MESILGTGSIDACQNVGDPSSLLGVGMARPGERYGQQLICNLRIVERGDLCKNDKEQFLNRSLGLADERGQWVKHVVRRKLFPGEDGIGITERPETVKDHLEI